MWPTIARVLGFALMFPVAFLYISSGLVVPGPYLFFLWALWGALLVIAIVKRHDWRIVLATPVVAFILWFVIVFAGGELLGWTA